MIKRIFIFFVSVVVALVVFIVVTNAVVYFGSRSHIYNNVEEVTEAQTAIVLGASVYSRGELTPIYKNRVDKALELYNAKKVSKILVSGDNGTNEYNEVDPVKNYLLDRGVPEADIFLDHAGFDTYSTMYRARDIFKATSVVVVTQSFHLPRAVFIGRALGIDAYGLRANDEHARTSNYIREIIANEKAMLNLITHRKPKYLGEVIPLDEEQPNVKPAPTVTVNNFEECENAGNPIMESYPRQCRHGDQLFVEDITKPTPTPPAGGCFVGGCSGQICSDQKDAASTCEFREEYACYKTATCERQSTGQCGWTKTPALTQCLNSKE